MALLIVHIFIPFNFAAALTGTIFIVMLPCR